MLTIIVRPCFLESYLEYLFRQIAIDCKCSNTGINYNLGNQIFDSQTVTI